MLASRSYMQYGHTVQQLILIIMAAVPSLVLALRHPPHVKYFDWKIQYANVTRLCHTKSVISVNGQFPGPTVVVKDGDTLNIKVTNLVPNNITIHWHGVRQLRSAWADGPEYITQCPIQMGQSYVYTFKIIDQRGTLFWHAHSSWLRATVHGAFLIRPKATIAHKHPYPVKPHQEFLVILGEWWIANVEAIVAQAISSGGRYNTSDALTLNGQPGTLYNCSLEDTPIFNVEKGRTYLLRIINAAMNVHLYFGVANHSLTVVEADAEYTQPLHTDVVVLAPGQTTNVLIAANQPQPQTQYMMAASVFSPARRPLPYPKIPTTGILQYVQNHHHLSPTLTPALEPSSTNDATSNAPNISTPTSNTISTLFLPTFPTYNDTSFMETFTQSLKGLYQPLEDHLPCDIDVDLLYTIGYSFEHCGPLCPLSTVPGIGVAGAINNITFHAPQTISLLQAYYNRIDGVYQSDFPDVPLVQYNYTGIDPTNRFSLAGTRVKMLDYGAKVQIVLQATATFFYDSHPTHLHGQNFYVVGSGVGNYNPNLDPMNFNLKDPPSRNTISVPLGGWVAIRFRATNPGVWFMHCHFDIHTTSGMSMAFIVKDGNRVHEKLPPPPKDMPMC